MGNRRVGGEKRLCLMLTLILGLGISPVRGGTIFHSGTTGSCDGCHGRQIPIDGQPVPAAPSGGMLKGSDPSSTCLLCHEAPVAGLREDHHVSTPGAAMGPGVPPRQLTPGGDFGWLKKSYRWTDHEKVGPGLEAASQGDRHGHNIVAADFNYYSDRTHTHAPGGTYPATGLTCISCHDPHGTYRRLPDGTVGTGGTGGTGGTAAGGSGSYPAGTQAGEQTVGVYRLLGGRGYQPAYDAAIPAFTADSPAAVAPLEYNRAETDTNTRVAYGSGMSEWCRNCHPSIHEGGASGHTAGNGAKLGGAIAGNYNAYIGSGNLTGSSAGSYTSLVPFEMGTDDYAILSAAATSSGSYSNGPGTGAGSPNVMCLTCHRAHASGWDSMARWNTRATFMVENGRYPGTDSYEASNSAHGRTSAETAKAYYDRRPSAFSFYQRSLCNKCHVKD